MSARRQSLTGAWSGAYRYPQDAGPETVFNVQIEEVGGAFVGAMHEPNIFAFGAGSVLDAEIEGVRSGHAVTFTKFYRHSGIKHAIRYEGAVDDQLMRIEGRWIIPGEWSGTFFMTRDDLGEAANVEREAEVDLDVKR